MNPLVWQPTSYPQCFDLAYLRASAAFDRLYQQARHRQFWELLTGRVTGLAHLGAACTHLAAGSWHNRGICHVPVAQIRGSAGRHTDFDTAFRPLQRHLRERWVQTALAYEARQALQTVKLVRIHDTTYVENGHELISVARLHGEMTIQANVIEWEESDLHDCS